AAIAFAFLELIQGADEVGLRQPGDAGRFRMTVAGGQVTERAGARLFPASIGNDRGHRRVVARGPVGRPVRVVDLDRVVFLLAARLGGDAGGGPVRCSLWG